MVIPSFQTLWSSQKTLSFQVFIFSKLSKGQGFVLVFFHSILEKGIKTQFSDRLKPKQAPLDPISLCSSIVSVI